MTDSIRVLSRPISVCFALVLAATTPVRADSPVYADKFAACAGLTPCFTTIQEAVNNATDPDAPLAGASAEVFVFPGDYPESVDLSLMGSAVAATPADLALHTVDDTGAPTPGTVTVNPATGSPFRNSISPFPGNSSVSGFSVLSLDNHGIALAIVTGSIDLKNVTADGNFSEGMNLFSSGDITIIDSSANQNGNIGIALTSSMGDVSFVRATAIKNATDGFSCQVGGNVNITNCMANDNGDRGAFFATIVNMSISGSQAINNMSDGFDLIVNGALNISDSFADVNGGRGFNFMLPTSVNITRSSASVNALTGFSFDVNGPVTITDSMAVRNGLNADGFNFGTATTVDITGTYAIDNGLTGFGVLASGIVHVSESFGDGNGLTGLEIDTVNNVVINSTSTDDNFGDGMSVDTTASVNINDSNADGNAGNGCLVSTDGEVSIANTTADRNLGRGFRIINLPTAVTVSGCSTNYNGVNGFSIAATDDVSVSDSFADGNIFSGMFIQTSGNILIASSSANDNDQDGVDVDSTAGGSLDISHTSADGNAFNGILVEPQNGGPLTISDTTADRNGVRGVSILGSVTGVSISGSSASGNTATGIWVKPTIDADATISNTTADRNGDYGINVPEGAFGVVNLSIDSCSASGNDLSGLVLEPSGIVDVSKASANRNRGQGVFVRCDGDVNITRTTLAQNQGEGAWIREGDVVTVQDSRFQENGGQGILLDTISQSATHDVTGSIICHNLLSGLRLAVNATVNAHGNWWGHVSGPMHASNPGGLGNPVAGGGTVLFDPWIDTITPSADPAVAGSPSQVNFQFSDTSVFLGQGPGDPNGDAPFTITTDNGVLTSSTGTGAVVMEFINNLDGVLTVELVPDNAGPANVTLLGPCGLDGAITVNVAAPPPGQQIPDSGDMNNGSFNGHGHCGVCGALGAALFPVGVLAYASLLLARTSLRRRRRSA